MFLIHCKFCFVCMIAVGPNMEFHIQLTNMLLHPVTFSQKKHISFPNLRIPLINNMQSPTNQSCLVTRPKMIQTASSSSTDHQRKKKLMFYLSKDDGQQIQLPLTVQAARQHQQDALNKLNLVMRLLQRQTAHWSEKHNLLEL